MFFNVRGKLKCQGSEKVYKALLGKKVKRQPKIPGALITSQSE